MWFHTCHTNTIHCHKVPCMFDLPIYRDSLRSVHKAGVVTTGCGCGYRRCGTGCSRSVRKSSQQLVMAYSLGGIVQVDYEFQPSKVLCPYIYYLCTHVVDYIHILCGGPSRPTDGEKIQWCGHQKTTRSTSFRSTPGTRTQSCKRQEVCLHVVQFHKLHTEASSTLASWRLYIAAL